MHQAREHSGRPLQVLLVEDDPGDVDLAREALQEAGSTLQLHVVDDGVKALAYLRREGAYAGAVQPDLILLDLNLPRKDGREVLRELKNGSPFKQIPIVVLTTSDADADIVKAYALGANCYVRKPMSLDQFTHVIRSIEDFWCHVAKLPAKGPG